MALPHPALWQSLCAYYQESTPYVEVLKLYNRANPSSDTVMPAITMPMSSPFVSL